MLTRCCLEQILWRSQKGVCTPPRTVDGEPSISAFVGVKFLKHHRPGPKFLCANTEYPIVVFKSTDKDLAL